MKYLGSWEHSCFPYMDGGVSTQASNRRLRAPRSRASGVLDVVHPEAGPAMPFNLPGTLVPLHLLISPRLVVPSLVVRGQSVVQKARTGLSTVHRKIFASLISMSCGR